MNTLIYREHVKYICDTFEYPEGAKEALLECFDKLTKKEGKLSFYVDKYDADELTDFRAILPEISEEAKEIGAEDYTAQLLLFVCCARRLKERYAEKGIDEKIWFNSVSDLKWKLIECHKLHGIWGSFVAGWFTGFFTMNRFALGRLQFEIISFNKEYEKDGNVIHEGDSVINIHIPSSGHMSHDLCEDAYKRAAEFFKDSFKGRKTVFCCSSWLLFPHNREILSPNSNIIKFMDDFDIYEMGYYSNYDELWRFFYKKYNGNPDDLPNELSMQRGYIKWIKEGNKTGWGKGVFFYEG